MEKQVDLSGRKVGCAQSLGSDVELDVLKSCLQKNVRRGLVERAMFCAYRMASLNPLSCWKRLNVIAVEDCLDESLVLVVSELNRQAGRFGYDSWDGKRCAVAAAYLLAEGKKNRISDEFLEVMEMLEKHSDDVELKQIKAELGKVEDYCLDNHTHQGRALGRGEKYWLETASFTTNRSVGYEDWREHFFKPLMLRLVKKGEK
jgi:replication-associated recombination protein RarA